MYVQIHKLTRNVLFILFGLYFAQGLIYEIGSLISKTSIVLIIAISIVYFVKSLLGNFKHDKFYIAWSILLVLNSIGFILIFNFYALHALMFKNILVCMISFYPFYFYAQKDLLKSKHLLWFFILMLSLTILQFYDTREIIILNEKKDEIVNNISYMFVALIPFVFLFKKNNLISGILISIILFYVIWANKRGAMISTALGAVIYAYYQLRTIEKSKLVRGYLFSFVVIIFIGYFAYSNYISNEYLIKRMDSIGRGEFSDRDFIYRIIFNSWFNSDNIWNYLFGFGFASSIELTGGYFAHNDWLELLASFGILGVGVYLYLFSVAIQYIRNKEWNTDKRILMLTITVVWFSVTVFSMWYLSMEMVVQTILMAYLIGSKKSSIV